MGWIPFKRFQPAPFAGRQGGVQPAPFAGLRQGAFSPRHSQSRAARFPLLRSYSLLIKRRSLSTY